MHRAKWSKLWKLFASENIRDTEFGKNLLPKEIYRLQHYRWSFERGWAPKNVWTRKSRSRRLWDDSSNTSWAGYHSKVSFRTGSPDDLFVLSVLHMSKTLLYQEQLRKQLQLQQPLLQSQPINYPRVIKKKLKLTGNIIGGRFEGIILILTSIWKKSPIWKELMKHVFRTNQLKIKCFVV